MKNYYRELPEAQQLNAIVDTYMITLDDVSAAKAVLENLVQIDNYATWERNNQKITKKFAKRLAIVEFDEQPEVIEGLYHALNQAQAEFAKLVVYQMPTLNPDAIKLPDYPGAVQDINNANRGLRNRLAVTDDLAEVIDAANHLYRNLYTKYMLTQK